MQVAESSFSSTNTTVKPTVLFVDDEKRVLNSMRAMFRREYNLFLTTRGDEALKIINEHEIDVVVADQRMPIMTGVEVLSAVKQQSPDTVRILLTGYADLDAIEGAMNDGEVFRFLSKPCAAEELRGTIKLATEIANETAGMAGEEEQDDDSLFLSAATDIADIGNAQAGDLLEDQGPTTTIAFNDSQAAIPLEEREPDNAFSGTVVIDQPPVSVPVPDMPSSDDSSVEIIMSGNGHHQVGGDDEVAHDATAVLDAAPVLRAPPEQPKAKRVQEVHLVGTGKYKVSVMVFTSDGSFAKSIGRSLQDYFYTFHATNVAHLMHGISKVAPAVLITDVSEDTDVIQQLTAQLKQKVPEMVTMVASQHRDADLMVKLINHGQVFRIVDKPLSSTACKRHVREAIKKHINLRNNPNLIQRHQVVDSGDSKLPASIGRLFGRLGRVRSLWSKKNS